MKYLELRRHSERVKKGEHLTDEGVRLARRVGGQMGPFARVIVSPSARTHETAVAMGFAVDDVYQPAAFKKQEWKDLGRLFPRDLSFGARAASMRKENLGKRLAQSLCAQWTACVTALPEGACALVVTHGGYIESSAVACLPDAAYEAWGGLFGHCEGIRLAFDGQEFVDGEILRVQPSEADDRPKEAATDGSDGSGAARHRSQHKDAAKSAVPEEESSGPAVKPAPSVAEGDGKAEE